MNKELIVLFLAIALIWYLMTRKSEAFDETGSEFVPVGQERYGIRGDLLSRSSIANNYLSPNRNIVLNPSTGQMYTSNNPPTMQGHPNCKQTKCPSNLNDYDATDTCHTCGTGCPTLMKIPDIHPH